MKDIFGHQFLIMEKNLANLIDGSYQGEIVCSHNKSIDHNTIQITRVNNLLINVKFSVDNSAYSFNAILSEQEEGILMIIQEKVEVHFKLSGLSGFLNKKPNIHGGYINKMESLYFHIILDYFDGNHREIYFIGQKPGFGTKKSFLNRQLMTQS